MKPLNGKVAVVAGATRGAGRGIACMLGAAGATVYCTGRSIRNNSAMNNRPESIEETAEMVSDYGGVGLWAQVDHTKEKQVKLLFERIKNEQGCLDILVNDIWGGDELTEWNKPFWELSLSKERLMFDRAIYSHIITSRYGVPLMLKKKQGIVIEVTDGDHYEYRGNLSYDLSKNSTIRLAYAMSHDLQKFNICSLAITPGYLRSEAILDGFGVSESNWRDAIQQSQEFEASETPFYIGRAVVALSSDPNILQKSGKVFSTWNLSKEYGFSDIDGSQPDWGKYFKGKILKKSEYSEMK
jgi:NAD(P)-dependent dehydrogenase (short-subunit alcohol dehydrogenase family)